MKTSLDRILRLIDRFDAMYQVASKQTSLGIYSEIQTVHESPEYETYQNKSRPPFSSHITGFLANNSIAFCFVFPISFHSFRSPIYDTLILARRPRIKNPLKLSHVTLTQPRFHWQASESSLVIGATSPAYIIYLGRSQLLQGPTGMNPGSRITHVGSESGITMVLGKTG